MSQSPVSVYTQPSKTNGLLVERLLADAADEPGSLPLLQEPLVLLWERMTGRTLTVAAYEALGQDGRSGLAVALALKADATYNLLTFAEQGLARRICLRLVAFGEGRPDTRRQQAVADLVVPGEDPALFISTLSILTDHRLLTTSGEGEAVAARKVDLGHETLIRGWPLLQHWIVERRTAEQTRRQLEEQATQWVRLGRSRGGSLDETELPGAERWLVSADAQELGASADLRELVQASRAGLDATGRAQAAANRRLRAIATGLAMVLILAVLAGALALLQTQAAVANQKEAERQAREARQAQASLLGIQAEVVLTTSPQLSLLLAAEAVTTTMRLTEPVPLKAEQALRAGLATIGGRGLGGPQGAVNSVAISQNGHWLVAGSADSTVRLWNLTAADPTANPRILRGHQKAVNAVAISGDGHWLVTGSEDGTAQVWDLTAADIEANVRSLGLGPPVRVVAISPDGHWLVTGGGIPGDPSHPARSPSTGYADVWDLTAADPTTNGRVFTSGDGLINAVAISGDGHWLVTHGDRGTTRLWDLTTADPQVDNRFTPWDGTDAVVISSDGHWVVTGRSDSTAQLRDLTSADPSANPRILRGHEDEITAVGISRDGHWLVTGSVDKTARLWDLRAADPSANPRILRGHEGTIREVAFSPDGQWLITADGLPGTGPDNTARLWNLTADDPAANSRILRGHAGPILTVAFSGDGHWLVTGSADGTARLWDLTTGDTAIPHLLGDTDPGIHTLAFSAGGHWLVTGSTHGTRLWDFTAGNDTPIPHLLGDPEGEIETAAISRDGHWLVTGSVDKTAQLWDLRAADPSANPRILRGHKDTISAVAFSPDGHWLVTAGGTYAFEGKDYTARLWDLTADDPAANPRILFGHQSGILDVAISPDGHWLVTTSWDHTARLWDLTAANPALNPRVLRGHQDAILAVAFSLDGHWLVTGSFDGTARLWELSAGNRAASSLFLPHPEGLVSSLAISADGHWLVTGSANMSQSTVGIARLWDLTAVDPAATARILGGNEVKVSTVAISPDGHWLVTGSTDGTMRLWDLQATDPLTTARVLPAKGESADFSPDEHWLVTSGYRGAGRLWDLTAVDPASASSVLPGYEGVVDLVTFSRDGHWLVTSSGDSKVRLWDLQLGDLVHLACLTAGRNLTSTEWQQYMGGADYRETCRDLPSGETLVPPTPGQ